MLYEVITRFGPAGVKFLDIEFEGHVREFEQVKQEQRRIGMRERRMIGHGTGARDPGIQFSEVDLLRILVDQEIQFEVTAVAFLDELLAETRRVFPRLVPDFPWKRIGEDLVV